MRKPVVDPAAVSLDETGQIILSDADLAVLEGIETRILAGGSNSECNGRVNSSCINDGACNDSVNSVTCTNSGQCNRSGNQVCQNDLPPAG